jgi:hypothetical protein
LLKISLQVKQRSAALSAVLNFKIFLIELCQAVTKKYVIYLFSFSEAKTLTGPFRSAKDNTCRRYAMSVGSYSDAVKSYFESVIELFVQSSHRLDMILSEIATIWATVVRLDDGYFDEAFDVSQVEQLDTAIAKNFRAIQAAHTLYEDSLRKQNALSNKPSTSECHHLPSQCRRTRLIEYPASVLKNDGHVTETLREYGDDFDHASTIFKKTLQASKVVMDCVKKSLRTLVFDMRFKSRSGLTWHEERSREWSDFRASDYQVFNDSVIQPSIVPSSCAR